MSGIFDTVSSIVRDEDKFCSRRFHRGYGVYADLPTVIAVSGRLSVSEDEGKNAKIKNAKLFPTSKSNRQLNQVVSIEVSTRD